MLVMCAVRVRDFHGFLEPLLCLKCQITGKVIEKSHRCSNGIIDVKYHLYACFYNFSFF